MNPFYRAFFGFVFVAASISLAHAGPSHAIAMHGEPKYDENFTHLDYVNPDAPKGGELRLWASDTFDNLNPFILKGLTADGASGYIFDTLMESTGDEPFTVYGLVAQSIETPKDRSWVVFHLRKIARFNDGVPITADDVVWTFNTLVEKGHPFYRFYYTAVEKVEKLDDHTVKFTFGEGDNRELPLIVGQLPVLPKHYWQDKKFSRTTLEPPLGSGPYTVKKVDPGRSIVYERVKDYWARDLPVKKGRHNFDRIKVDYYRDSTVALEAFKAGEYDWRLENTAKLWATGYDFPALNEGRVKKVEIPHMRSTGMQGFAFNIRQPIFSDPRVRRALAYAYNFELANKQLFHGQYTRTASYFSNSRLASTGLPTGAELKVLEPFRGKVPEEVFTTEYLPPAFPEARGRDPFAKSTRTNLRVAIKLLSEAGWKVNKSGKLVNKNGERMEFEILLINPAFERIALPFVKNMEKLGIVARVRTVDATQYENRLREFDFDMTVAVFGQSQSPGNEQGDYWGSESAKTPGGKNIIGIADPVIDELVDKVIASADREELETNCRALDRVLLWGHYLIPNWHTRNHRVAYWNKFGRPEVNPPYDLPRDAWWALDAVK